MLMEFQDFWTLGMSLSLETDEEEIGLWNEASKLAVNDETSNGVVGIEEKRTWEAFKWALRVQEREGL